MMTATQVFLMFLKERCTLKEYLFFKHTITKNHGNKFFRKRKLYHDDFVEKYLSRNNRALNNFMTRMFILAPNLCHNKARNPRWKMLVDEYNKKQIELGSAKRFLWGLNGMYVNYYRREWNKFLREHIESDKKFNSPFKKKEEYSFRYKEKG